MKILVENFNCEASELIKRFEASYSLPLKLNLKAEFELSESGVRSLIEIKETLNLCFKSSSS